MKNNIEEVDVEIFVQGDITWVRCVSDKARKTINDEGYRSSKEDMYPFNLHLGDIPEELFEYTERLGLTSKIVDK